MRILPILALLCAVHAVYYPATSPLFTYSGRRYTVKESIAYDWPCFRIAFCFKDSTQVTWHIEDTWNIYNISLDGNQSKRIEPKKNTTIEIFSSNQPSSHCIEIFKITENHYGPLGSHTDSLFRGV